MIYSFSVFIFLILRNYLNKKQRYLCNSLIIQILILLSYKKGMGVYGSIIGIIIISNLARRLEIGNHDGNRNY